MLLLDCVFFVKSCKKHCQTPFNNITYCKIMPFKKEKLSQQDTKAQTKSNFLHMLLGLIHASCFVSNPEISFNIINCEAFHHPCIAQYKTLEEKAFASEQL